MHRFAVVLVVSLLSLSASGLAMLAVGEPCADFEQSQSGDSACPPTCVTCGCCAQAVEPQSFQPLILVDAPPRVIAVVISRLLKSDPREILHVPKPRLA